MVPLTIEGAWEGASEVLVGDLKNMREVGVERNPNLPRDSTHQFDHIYWCEAGFTASAVIKGSLPPDGAKWLWGSTRPGCKLDLQGLQSDGQGVTRVWFLREESGYLRPVADARAVMVLTFLSQWDVNSRADPQTRFAELLLNPSANSTGSTYFAQTLFESASAACVILGQDRCKPKLRKLTTLGDPELSREVCGLLSSQFREECLK
jgi:hypothetical protein